MASERTPGPVKGYSTEERVARAFFTGAGAAAIVVTPNASVPLRDNFAAPKANVATAITRNGVGDHTVVLPRRFKRTLFADPRVTGTTALQSTVTTITDNADGTLTLRILTATPAGVATDMAATDIMRIKLEGSDSTD